MTDRSERFTRATLRRAAASTPDGDRLSLLPLLAHDDVVAPLAPEDAVEVLMRYLLDPSGRAILGIDEQRTAWFTSSPLLRPCGPGCAAPLADDLAAVLVAPMLARANELPEVLLRWRWSPRADELIAATVASLEPAAGARALAQLRAPGRDEEHVHQAALQAGRALAWAPHLHGSDDARAIVGELVALLDRASPRPLLDALTRALGPIARAATELGETVRTHALAQLGAAVDRITGRAQPAGFAAQLAALDQPTGHADLEHMKRMPDWEHAEYCTHILGAAAPEGGARFSDWHAVVSGLFQELPLLPAFLDGLIQSAAVEPMAQLVTVLADSDEEDRELAAHLAAQLPVAAAEPAILAVLEDERPSVRVSAIRALALIEVIEPIARRLEDPVPEVAAAAALALVELGEGARCAARAADPNAVRRAAIAAATGATDTETIGELTAALADQLDAIESTDELDGSPLLDALTASLLTTPEGLHRTAALLGGFPAALPIVALALPRDEAQTPGLIAPPEPLAELEQSLRDLLAEDSEPTALALGLLAGLSCGDAALAARIAAALDETDGYAGQLLVALAELRVRTPEGAAAIAPLLAADQPITGRIIAGAAAGRILPVDHAAWSDVIALLSLGTYARAAAWASLRDRLRYA